MLGSGEPRPQSKLTSASERTRAGFPLTSGLTKYSPRQAAPGAGAGDGAGVRVGAGAAVGLMGSGVSVGSTGLGDGALVGVKLGAAVAVGTAGRGTTAGNGAAADSHTRAVARSRARSRLAR